MEHSLSITRKMHRYARKIFFTDFMSAELTGTLLLAICWYFIGIFTGGILSGDETRVAVSYENLHNEIFPGERILVNNGLLIFEVVSVEGKNIHCKTIAGGVMSDRKSMSFPD